MEKVIRSLSMKVKRGIKKSIILPTLSYASETWIWNAVQQSKVHAVEMSFIRGESNVSVWN